ncbi:fungal-specific transcription factor domain-containing protein [Mycena rebaudengoi]|nr:fungal-specific transcription factor domain-containing protein [Mycena rebaudengoi]
MALEMSNSYKASVSFPKDAHNPLLPGSKRRRLTGACDTCKQRKSDSAKMPGGICSNCIAYNSECTHQGFSKTTSVPSEPPKPAGSSSQDHLDRKSAEEHVQAIVVHSTAYIASEDLRNVLLSVARYSRGLEQELAGHRISGAFATSLDLTSSADSSSSEEDEDEDEHGVVINSGDTDAVLSDIHTEDRFFGKSNSLFLIQMALDAKGNTGLDSQPPTIFRRPQFWDSPWERPPFLPPPVLRFPPKDLLDDLLDIYFTHIHILLCTLHRPTFEESIAHGLHLINHRFGSIVLCVCALAARFSEDPRVVLAGTNSRLSAGWEWFCQVQPFRTNHADAPTLYDLQVVFLSIAYLQGTCSTDACWRLCSDGLRDAQDIGIHVRKRRDRTTMTIEDELFKRTFWMLVGCDAIMSAFLGRPRATTDKDYDIDYPVEVDDEYWENTDPEKRFQQAVGKPSMYSFLVSYLKLVEILGLAQKTIYSVKRSQHGRKWIETAVAELDSALNKWVDSIPDHLRWDPNREDQPFTTQSACLYAAYYHVQIQVHRSFIPSPTNKNPLSSSFPSLAICANSARSCSHVMETQLKRGLVVNPQVLNAMLDSAMILCLNVWGGRKSGVSADPHMAANDVQKCIKVLKMYEQHWQVAGRYNALGNISLPTEVPNLKRVRNSESPPPDVSSPPSVAHRNLAGSQRASAAIQQHQPPLDVNHLFGLPIYTQDLGHLPVYESFEWNLPFGSDTTQELSSEFAFILDVPYGVNNNFAYLGPVNDSTQYSPLNTLEDSHRHWADQGSYVDSGVDQLLQSLDSEAEVSPE